MAASTKMPFNHYQNGKYGTLPQNQAQDMEVTNDMHLKMSKKIAQLTKVIYALNTKNDEHEAVVQQIKEQHEEEVQQLLKETKEKVSSYKTKLDGESRQNRRIEQLETTLTEFESVKNRHVSQFDSFKKSAEDREIKLKQEHAEKMLELSKDVLHTKKDFEDKLKQFEVWKAGIDDETEKKLQDLRNAHKKDLEDVHNRYQDQSSGKLDEIRKIEEKYQSEIESLHAKYKELSDSKKEMADDYEAKLAKAQLFYEKELEAVMKMNNISQDEANKMLMEEKEKLKKEFAMQEAELRKQLNSVLGQLTDKEDEVDNLKSQLETLQKSMQENDGSSQQLLQQLQSITDQSNAYLAKLKEAESELSVMKERCSRQEDELVKKSSTIGHLEATKLQNESTIQELESLTNKLKDKLAWLEKERNNLEKQNCDLNQSQLSQLKSLEKSLEDLSIEKQTMKEKYERDLDCLRNNSNKSEKGLLQHHQDELEKLRQQLLNDLTNQKADAEKKLEETKREMTKLRETEVSLVTEDRDNVRAELERIKSELSSRLKAAEDEVARVNGILQSKEDGLGSATGMINSLKDANSQLQQHLEKARADYKEEKTRTAALQAELDKLRLKHEANMKQAKLEFQEKIDKVSADLDAKLQETLRRECNKLREEVNAQKESEMRAALEQLARLKDEEIAATKMGWEVKVEDLQKQLANLKLSIQSSESKSQDELDKIRQANEAERKRLEQEMLNSAADYMNKIKAMEAMHDENVKKLMDQKLTELDELQRTLKDKHIEDMQAQMSAHKATIDSVKEQAIVSKLAELKTQKEQMNKEKEDIKDRMYEKHKSETDRMVKEHEAHMQAARMELERAVEISKQKEKDHALRVEDLQGEISERERHINNLKEDAGKFQITVNQLNKEIEFKRQEIQKIKLDVQNQIRMVEKKARDKMEREMQNLQADHLRESQELVRQFNEAQEILKDKISELQLTLEEAEERYHNRESRPEDLELIHQLREAIYDKEEKIKALHEEKKFFQMELVNRETNFNKVFSASPNVGVLNPLDARKKKGKSTNSAPNLSGRLDPLPGSPMHNSQLNPSKPLPPFAKKFVK